MNGMRSDTELPSEAIASFNVRINSVQNATWQGVAEIGGTEYRFSSELELLHLLMEQFPVLRPNVTWTSNG